ncbi:MAG: hypothetical protein H6827_09280 [Planctomycetes bacterium]|nr:hypothetical protein [Planctomycetota bacterium]
MSLALNNVMKIPANIFLSVVGVATVCLVAKPARAGGIDWRFPIGITYANGFQDVGDAIDENPGVDVEYVLPVGISLRPYAELTDIGLGFGVSVGPAMLGVGDYSFYAVPLGVDVRYTFFRKSKVAPYVVVGARYAVAGGDFVGSGDMGFFGGVGVELFRRPRGGVALGLEVGYDSSTIDVQVGNTTREVEPIGWNASVHAVF